jgi:hypothetical protein
MNLNDIYIDLDLILEVFDHNHQLTEITTGDMMREASQYNKHDYRRWKVENQENEKSDNEYYEAFHTGDDRVYEIHHNFNDSKVGKIRGKRKMNVKFISSAFKIAQHFMDQDKTVKIVGTVKDNLANHYYSAAKHIEKRGNHDVSEIRSHAIFPMIGKQNHFIFQIKIK